MELRGILESEDWGKTGINSSAGKIYWNAMKRNLIKTDVPYSAFRIVGPHECIVVDTGDVFNKFLAESPCVLGKCKDEFGGKLPFEVAVISSRLATPIRFHPDVEDTIKFHKGCSNIEVKEPKVKILMALTCFELLCALRPIEQLKNFLLVVPELKILIPQEKIEDYVRTTKRFHLQDIFIYWLTASKDAIRLAVDMFFERMDTKDTKTRIKQYCGVIKRLHQQHGYDPGVFAPFFFNYLILNPNESIFIDCSLPYCYILGDCLEVSSAGGVEVKLALSSSVNIAAAVEYLDFRSLSHGSLMLHPRPINDVVTRYLPPIMEFALDVVRVKKGNTCSLPVHKSCSIFLVTRGKASAFIRPSSNGYREFTMGTVIFIFPNQKLTFTTIEDICLYHVYPHT